MFPQCPVPIRMCIPGGPSAPGTTAPRASGDLRWERGPAAEVLPVRAECLRLSGGPPPATLGTRGAKSGGPSEGLAVSPVSTRTAER